MINTYFEFGLAQVQYTGSDIGRFLEIEIINSSNKVEHFYFEGINPAVNNGKIPTTTGPYRGFSINEVFHSEICDNIIQTTYRPDFTIKARFIDEMPYPESITFNLNTSAFDYTISDNYYNITKDCNLTFPGTSTTINLTFYFNCWVIPNKKSFNGYLYAGPLEDFSTIKNCICSLKNYLGNNSNELNELKDLAEEFRNSLGDYLNTSLPLDTDLCIQLEIIYDALNDNVLGYRINNTINEKKIEILENLFLNILNKLRNLLWRFGNIEISCFFNKFYTNSQKGNLYMQASGYDAIQGSVYDGMPAGIYLRWAFQTGHLPSGRLKTQNYGPFTKKFNSYGNMYYKNDYVYIYRTRYTDNQFKTILNASNTNNLILVSNIFEYQTNLYFKSKATFKYNNGQAYEDLFNIPNITPTIFNSFEFYNDYIEISFEDLCFAFEIDFISNNNVELRIETISKNAYLNENYISSRQTVSFISSANPNSFRVENESIEKIRIQFLSGSNSPAPISISEIRYETYDDFEGNTPVDSWDLIGNFCMTINDELAINKRLIDIARGIEIEKKWPKYIDNVVIKEDNYVNKWIGSNAEPGVKALLIKYLREEHTIVENNTEGYDSDFTPELNNMELSIDQIIQTILTDFHFARMIGMGYIDNSQEVLTGERFIYKAIYSSSKNYGFTINDQVYLSLPTGINDYRPPMIPKIETNFGFDIDDCSNNKDFDEFGYSKVEKRRLINFKRKAFPFEKPFDSFFQFNNELFNMGTNTTPVLIGVDYQPPNSILNYEYNSITNSEDTITDYQIDLTNPNQIAYNPVRETQPILCLLGKFFSQQQTIEGIYNYKFYGIDWFGKFSSLFNVPLIEIETDFINKGVLKSPVQIHAHYIQLEETPLLSTNTEQLALQDRMLNYPQSDNVYTRLKFGLNHIHKINFQSATHLEVFFRKDPIGLIQGRIKDITENNDLALVKVENFNIYSGNEIKHSNIEDLNNNTYEFYIGSNLITESGAFKIKEIVFDEADIIVVLYKNSEPIINSSNNTYIKHCVFITPKIGEQFTIEENWAGIDTNTLLPNNNWQKLNQTINLCELDTDNNNKEFINGEEFIVGGFMQEDAEFEKIVLSEPLEENVVIYNNYYKFTLDFVLPIHSQFNVEWNSGLLRIYNSTDNIYNDFEVLAIEPNPTNIYLLDVYVLDDNDLLDYLEGLNNVKINYHPYYKTYLQPETYSGAWFNREHILPSNGNIAKETYIAVRTVYFDSNDLIYNNNFRYSQLSVPIPLISFGESTVYIQDPLQGNLYTSKPDFYGNSSYSIDLPVGINNKPLPFSLVYYRSTWMQILNSIYKADTVSNLQNILKDEANLEIVNDLINDIINVDIYSEGELKEYGNFTLPEPDNVWDLNNIPEQLTEKIELIKNSIEDSFVPIHENPVVLDFLKTGKSTSNQQPKIREKGQLIDYSLDQNSKFNPHPYATKFLNSQNNYVVRFTDYNIPGSSNDMFFYYVKELGFRNNIGKANSILGPVYLRNNFPPPCPVISTFQIIPANIYLNTQIKVEFNVNKVLKTANISYYKLFRTENKNLDGDITKMKFINSFSLNEIIEDDFSDYEEHELPFDLKFYYRIVAVKLLEIPGEQTEEIYSQPSDSFEIVLFDNLNPQAPDIEFSCTGHNGLLLNNVIINFTRQTYKGKYYLYEQNSSGNWSLVTNNNLVNPIVNEGNIEALQFQLGNIEIKDIDDNYIYKRYKISVENISGLLNLSEKEFGLTSFFVPQPYLKGPKVVCINQSKDYSVIKSKNTNTIEWIKDGNLYAGNTTEIQVNWNSLGEKSILVTETDPVSNISITKEIIIQVKEIPSPSIIGPAEILINESTEFETNDVSGNYYYWQINDTDAIIENQGTSLVQITFLNQGLKDISVIESNGGCSNNYLKQINVFDFQFTGNTEPDINNTESYVVFNYSGCIYLWQVDPAFGNIIGNNNQEVVSINWLQQGTTNLNLIVLTALGKQFEFNYEILVN